jgi:DNA-binding NarL/FixJ family response regulator
MTSGHPGYATRSGRRVTFMRHLPPATIQDLAPVHTVLLCDSTTVSRQGIQRALRNGGVTVVAVATSARHALRCLERHPTSIVLVDVDLFPAPSAIDVIGRASDAGAVPIAFDSYPRPDKALSVIRAGARGYLTKDQPAQTWLRMISAASRGEAVLSREMTGVLLEAWRTSIAAVRPHARTPLSNREWEVLVRVAEGKTNRDIAAELCITAETARNHVSRILTKLNLPNRTAAASRYRDLIAKSA